jgi:hypothetical protein
MPHDAATFLDRVAVDRDTTDNDDCRDVASAAVRRPRQRRSQASAFAENRGAPPSLLSLHRGQRLA